MSETKVGAPVEGMQTKEWREKLLAEACTFSVYSTNAYLVLKSVIKSHDICERALREAQARHGTVHERMLLCQRRADDADNRSVEFEKRITTLESALQSIRDLKVEQFDHPPEEWAKHTPETCEECKRWKDMKHPLRSGNIEKAKHHCISSAAALRNWHAHIRSGSSAMRPGIAEPKSDAAMKETP